jgi:hypothetical protein
MPYRFTFDLSRIPRFFFTEIAKASYEKGMHRKMGKAVQKIMTRFKIQEATGLNLSDAVILLQDLIDMQSRNLIEKERFVKSKKRVLFLPHCSRKYMDNHCKAAFDPSIPSYICAHCSPDCLVNKSVFLAEKKGYDVYVLPGGSCVPKILETKNYEGVVGVACGEEVALSGDLLKSMGVAVQGVPLIKNGCANTIFNLETLVSILSQETKA